MKLTLKNEARMSHISKTAAVDIEFNDLMYSVPDFGKESNLILRGINGQFKSGELTAILGPSGAGKSTLLNILTGYKCTNVSGSISINGQPRKVREFRKMSCYVMQENVVQPNLTVIEAMTFAADLKLGKRKSRFEKCVIIDEILNTLRLSASRNTISEKLSGGEKKRLMIALELVNNPPIIFLDEPTSGLDELSSFQCIELLQKLAHIGHTVICSIHTPSAKIFQKFDHVYVITAGQCIYGGSSSNLVPYLQSVDIECPRHYNPADFVIEISSGEHGFDLTERMTACVEMKAPILQVYRSKQEFELEKKNYPRQLRFDQFSILMKRMMLQLYRNRNYLYLKICLYVFLGFVIGGLFYDMGYDGSKSLYNFGFCYTTVMIFLYIPTLPILLWFPEELVLVKRECFNGWYNISSYFWALTLTKIPEQMVLGLIYLSIAYLITGQPIEWQRCPMFFGASLLTGFIAESIAYTLASICNIAIGVFVGPVLFTILALLALQNFGITNPLPLHRTILMYMSYVRYTMEALLAALYGNGREKLFCPLNKVFCYYSTPKKIFGILGMQTAPNFWLNIFILIIILCICKGILYYLLRQRVQRNKTFRILHLAKTLCTRYTCSFAKNVFRTGRNVSGNEEAHTTVGLHVFS